jgi:hypothetical protein
MRLAGQQRVPDADSKVILVEEIGRMYQKLSGKTGGKSRTLYDLFAMPIQDANA